MSKIKTRPFDVSNYLNDEADIAASSKLQWKMAIQHCWRQR